MIIRKFTVLVLLLLALAVSSAAAQPSLESIPNYERYKQVQDKMSSLAVGGSLRSVRWSDDSKTLRFMRLGQRFEVDLLTLELREIEEPQASDSKGDARSSRRRPARGRQRDREKSPDGKWIAVCRDWNVIIESSEGDESIHVTQDGKEKYRYGQASWVYGEELSQTDAMWWSPDSKLLGFYEFDERLVPDHYLLKGWSELHTEVLREGYPKPGEPNPIARLRVYDLQNRRTIKIDVGDDPDQYIYRVRFSPDGSSILFSRMNRLQNRLELMSADPRTGQSRVILTETQPTWQASHPEMQFLKDQQRFIWGTEKSGFKHYELRDLDGHLHATLTHGGFPVQSIERIDEDRGVLYYTAASGAHPLNAHLNRVDLDGQNQIRLTPIGATHRVNISPDGRWFVSTFQTLTTPPTTALFDSGGKKILTLAESDTSTFEQLGLIPVEPFVCLAADGVTEMYGVLYKPSDFDPNRRYPLLIDVYGGPHSRRVSNNYRPARAECEFGWLIAVVDNRGTRGRGKAFEGATYLQLGVVDLDDQAAGVRYLCQRSYVDSQHVGVYGHSYGGYMSALAILRYPDLFQVAAAGAPVTDWRQYDSIYTERFLRTPQENPDGYDAGSCMTYADQLQGKLLIQHGMRDDNVHPNNTWQLLDALNNAEKSVDVVWYPDRKHSLGLGSRRLMWRHLYRNLIGDIPTNTPSSAVQNNANASLVEVE